VPRCRSPRRRRRRRNPRTVAAQVAALVDQTLPPFFLLGP
jgi:hypothetical protein